jgi:hypothetical protein
MFEVQYNEEMEAEIRRMEAQQRATAAGHSEWANACVICACELSDTDTDRCHQCR